MTYDNDKHVNKTCGETYHNRTSKQRHNMTTCYLLSAQGLLFSAESERKITRVHQSPTINTVSTKVTNANQTQTKTQ